MSTEYENKKKDTAAMTTVKHDVSNGKLHENCYSQGEYLLVRLLFGALAISGAGITPHATSRKENPDTHHVWENISNI